MWRRLLLPALVLLLPAAPALAQSYQVERVASGLARPVFLTAPPGDRERVFVLEQHAGQIRILRLADRTLLPTPFLTVPPVSTGTEQGLLGLAFHPDHASNGLFYVYYTDPTTRVVRYAVSMDPDVADASSATPVLSIAQPQANHNGGWIGFGPDGMLYVATGDGGGSDDNDTGHTAGIGNAQDITDNLLGKILRVDVDGDDFPADAQRNYALPPDNPFVGVTGDDEIWAFGLRNPWRAGFDRATGDLYIGDVGQSWCEEIDVQPWTSNGGENYGWRLREGSIATPTGEVGGEPPPGAVPPLLDYPHNGRTCTFASATGFFGNAVTGGYVYRGPVPALQGRYFFADYARGDLWSFAPDAPDVVADLVDHSTDPDFAPDVGSIDTIASFGEDDRGNLYALDLDGEVFLLPEPPGRMLVLAGLLGVLALPRGRRLAACRESCDDARSAPEESDARRTPVR